MYWGKQVAASLLVAEMRAERLDIVCFVASRMLRRAHSSHHALDSSAG